ncbi:DUF3558 family protein [Pseudonocardia sp. NPDC049635]|uniref:DUF3558 family protein n=1 Tax=Pseudonocardia sp. NPDC049635 TaxID=3155506 RepID=UPI0033E76960
MERPAPRHAAVVLALALAVLAGCANSTPTGPFPPRPADIDTNTVDLCTALTPEQQDELEVGPGMAKTAELSDGPTRICSWNNFDDGYNYSVQTLPVPAHVVVGSPGSTTHVIDGYGVVRITDREDSTPVCANYVDASDAFGLRIQVLLTGASDDAENERINEVCERSSLLTSRALRNLQRAS